MSDNHIDMAIKVLKMSFPSFENQRTLGQENLGANNYNLGLGNLGGARPTGHRWVKGDGDVWYRANKADAVVGCIQRDPVDASLWSAGTQLFVTKEAALKWVENQFPD